MSRVAEIIGATGGGLAIIGLLWRIAWSLGQLTQQFTDHLDSSAKIHADQETRIRSLETRARRLR